MLRKINCRIIGVAPLLMNNGNTADPLNSYAKAQKEITTKRKKTDEDHARIADIQWEGSLYINEKGWPVIPGEYIEGTMSNGAKQNRLGKVFKAGLFVEGAFVIEHNGPKTYKELSKDLNYRDTRMVRVGTSKVPRTRAIFRQWALTFAVMFNDSILELDQIKKALEDAGSLVGIGDYIPKYGRFVIDKFELQK